MRKITGFVISVPLLAVSFSLPIHNGAWARGLAPVNVVEILAKSRAVDGKCKYLSAKEHDELNSYVAKAEVAASMTSGVGAAKTARSTGKKKGRAMACGENSQWLVNESMRAARVAMSRVEGDTRSKRRIAASNAAEKPRKARKKTPKKRKVVPVVRRVKHTDTKHNKTMGITSTVQINGNYQRRSKHELAQYELMVTAYYVDYRCRHLRQGDAKEFWHGVMNHYHNVIEHFGGNAVARVQNRAKSKARKSGSCNARTASIVSKGFQKASVN